MPKLSVQQISRHSASNMALSYPIHSTTIPGKFIAELSNKKLMTILKKIAGNNKKSWDSKIKYALWVDRITKKGAIGKTPFELVYGSTASLPI